MAHIAIVNTTLRLTILQGTQQAGLMVRDSDSEDEAELDAYSDFDALDGGEVEVSPEDEQALAAFMVRAG